MAALLIRGTRLEIKTPSILVNPHNWWQRWSLLGLKPKGRYTRIFEHQCHSLYQRLNLCFIAGRKTPPNCCLLYNHCVVIVLYCIFLLPVGLRILDTLMWFVGMSVNSRFHNNSLYSLLWNIVWTLSHTLRLLTFLSFCNLQLLTFFTVILHRYLIIS